MADQSEISSSDTQFVAECAKLHLTPDDIHKYGGGFEQPNSGKPDARADIIAFNKTAMATLMKNPDALRDLKQALAPFVSNQTAEKSQ